MVAYQSIREGVVKGGLFPDRLVVVLALVLVSMLLAACMAETGDSRETREVEVAEDTPIVAVATATESGQNDGIEATPPSAAEAATASIPLLPTVTNSPIPVLEPSPEPVDWTQTASVEGDYFVLGNPDAPVRLIDFSDFL